MPTVDWHCRRIDGVTLVEAVVTGDQRRQVRIENELDGPVWPPRRRGLPEAGWDDDGYEGTVGPDERLVVGYASPAPPADPPVRLAEGTPDDGLTPRDVVRTLGDGGPPRAAVSGSAPAGEGSEGAWERGEGGDENRESGGGSMKSREDGGENRESEARGEHGEGEEGDCARDGQDGSEQGDSGAEGDTSEEDPVEAWLAAVQQRIAQAERLAAADSVAEAERAIDAVGGHRGLRSLQAQLQRDCERLEAVQTQCQRVEEQAAAVDIPVETLARLA